MSIFFEPITKVQRDRRIMRDTDTRMAKYSRRGVILNFVVFCICVFGGRFFQENRELTIVLTTGLFVLTLLRGFLLFRFDSLYPRAPSKWRNMYFAITLFGSLWWGTILVSVVVALRFDDVAPLLLLYNVIFFSTTAHAFAPYQTFLSYYQFFGIIPAALAAFWLRDLMSLIYGALLLMYYLILTHQCRLMSENYWEKLAASYALAQKAFQAEEEKREGKASLRLSKEFLARLDDSLLDFRNAIHNNPTLPNSEIAPFTKLAQNIHDFRAIVYKDINIENNIFNIRHELQYLVSEFIERAETKEIQIETSLSPTLPMRLKGDATRFAQVIKALLGIYIYSSEKCSILIEVQFLREYEKAGELYVTFRRVTHGKTDTTFVESNLDSHQSLSLVVAKGLAEAMAGSIELIDSNSGEFEYRFNAKLDIADIGGQLDFHRGRFSGQSIMLVHSSPAIVDIKRQELDALGFSVVTETQHKRAKQTLLQALKQGKVIENIIFYYEPYNAESVRFISEIHKADELKYINKIIASTPVQQSELIKQKIDNDHNFYFVNKPVGLFELESTFDAIFSENSSDEDESDFENVILYDDIERESIGRRLNLSSLTESSCKIVDSIDSLKEKLHTASVIVIPCDGGIDVSSVVNAVRHQEQKVSIDDDCEFIPIVGVSSGDKKEGLSAFETGVDDFIDLSSSATKTLDSSLNYWESLNNAG